MKSQKEIVLDEKLLVKVKDTVQTHCPEDDLPVRIMEELIATPEVKAIQDYSNNVSINRLGFNDHGPVEMKEAVGFFQGIPSPESRLVQSTCSSSRSRLFRSIISPEVMPWKPPMVPSERITL